MFLLKTLVMSLVIIDYVMAMSFKLLFFPFKMLYAIGWVTFSEIENEQYQKIEAIILEIQHLH
jgi:hypothetical protein